MLTLSQTCGCHCEIWPRPRVAIPSSVASGLQPFLILRCARFTMCIYMLFFSIIILSLGTLQKVVLKVLLTICGNYKRSPGLPRPAPEQLKRHFLLGKAGGGGHEGHCYLVDGIS